LRDLAHTLSAVTGLSFAGDVPVTSAEPAQPWNRRGYMYIDPTAGSLVLQVLAAGALSALAVFARLREGLKQFFRSLLPRRWAQKR
jgi:hypothetical protein